MIYKILGAWNNIWVRQIEMEDAQRDMESMKSTYIDI